MLKAEKKNLPSPRTYENITNANGTLIIGLPKVNGTKRVMQKLQMQTQLPAQI